MRSMSKKNKPQRIFISHISEEAVLAGGLKRALEADFLGLVDIFVSSDTKSIAAGEEWLKSIEKALHSCAIMIVVCSPESIIRSWINFEAGAAWIRKISLIPVCHSGLLPKDLPPPLSFRQGLAIKDADGLRCLYRRVAALLSCKVPTRDFQALAHELTEGAFAPLPAGRSSPENATSNKMHTFSGLRLETREGEIFQDFDVTQPGGNINVVQYLWADAFRGGRICARVNSGGFCEFLSRTSSPDILATSQSVRRTKRPSRTYREKPTFHSRRESQRKLLLERNRSSERSHSESDWSTVIFSTGSIRYTLANTFCFPSGAVNGRARPLT